jgi:hypothetical protein
MREKIEKKSSEWKKKRKFLSSSEQEKDGFLFETERGKIRRSLAEITIS